MSMFNIEVDLKALSDVYSEIQPDLSILQQGIISASQYIRDVWVSAVQGTVLPGMTDAVNDDKYARSLATGESMRFPAPLYGVVMPVGYDDGAAKIEDGYGPYDMKPGLLNGPKSRPLKNGQGRYNTVPIRHMTPTGNSSNPITVKMKMPNEIYAQANKLTRSMPDASGKMNWGESLQVDDKPAMSWTGYMHQSNVYDGMYRVGAEKHTQYLTFRRVSTSRIQIMANGRERRVGSAEDSWIHPGMPPNPLIAAVYNYCMPEVERNLMAIAEQAFGSR